MEPTLNFSKLKKLLPSPAKIIVILCTACAAVVFLNKVVGDDQELRKLRQEKINVIIKSDSLGYIKEDLKKALIVGSRNTMDVSYALYSKYAVAEQKTLDSIKAEMDSLKKRIENKDYKNTINLVVNINGLLNQEFRVVDVTKLKEEFAYLRIECIQPK